jgi:hypothetical protein
MGASLLNVTDTFPSDYIRDNWTKISSRAVSGGDCQGPPTVSTKPDEMINAR